MSGAKRRGGAGANLRCARVLGRAFFLLSLKHCQLAPRARPPLSPFPQAVSSLFPSASQPLHLSDSSWAAHGRFRFPPNLLQQYATDSTPPHPPTLLFPICSRHCPSPGRHLRSLLPNAPHPSPSLPPPLPLLSTPPPLATRARAHSPFPPPSLSLPHLRSRGGRAPLAQLCLQLGDRERGESAVVERRHHTTCDVEQCRPAERGGREGRGGGEREGEARERERDGSGYE